MKKEKRVYYGATPEEVIQFGMKHRDPVIVARGLRLKLERSQ